jgi:CIC family chloride channel protein
MNPVHDPAARDFSADRRLLILGALAPIIGTAGALAAWLLLKLISLATNLAYFGRLSTQPVQIADNHLGLAAALVPVAGCLIIGLMARYGSEKIRGHGIPEAIEAILIGRSRIQPKVALLKPLSSAISIGTGGPFGAEGPIIMTGGAIGSLIAQLFHLTDAERKTLLVAGAAAGMAATFGTPVAAMLLAVELLLFEWKPRSFVPVALAAIVAAAWRPLLLGGGALFPMTMSAPLAASGLLLCAVLGIVAGLASGALTGLVYGCEDLFQRLPLHWMWWPALGGLAIGLGGLIEPRALGVGYDNIAALLTGGMNQPEAARLLVVKSLIWSIALGSGTSGGVLAPLLMMGGIIGLLFGHATSAADPALWALIGMAAMMGGTMRAPLTAIVFALELTMNVGALLPLAVACSVAHGTTVLLLKRSILTEKIARRGNHIVREYAIDPFEITPVGEIMVHAVDTLPADMPVAEAREFFTGPGADQRHRIYPVVDEGRPVAMVSRADILRWIVEGDPEGVTLGAVLRGRPMIIGYADEPVARLADRMIMADAGRAPIVRRADGMLVGLVARRDLLKIRARQYGAEKERQALIRFGAPQPETDAPHTA